MARGPRSEGAAKARETLSIGALSRATRIPVETIRTWEQRYGSPTPMRKPSGHRLYPAGAVEQLRLVSRLLVHGHRPAEILTLALPDLHKLLALYEPASTAVDAGAAGDVVGRLMRAAAELDRGATMQELRWSWARLGPLRFLEQVAGPFMEALGVAWNDGRIEVRHEHFASACIEDFLRSAREPFDQQARGPRVVLTTLPGERHEGGLVMASVLFAVRGYRVLYLGLDVPLEQITAAVRGGDAEVVAVSVSAAMATERAVEDLARLRSGLPRRVALWVGGGGALFSIKGVERFDSLSSLDARLGATA